MNPRSPTALPPQYHFLEGAEEGEASLYTIPQPNPLLEMLRLAAVNATMAQLMHMPMQPVTLPNTPVITVQQTQVNPALFVANETNNVIGKNGKSKKKTKPGKNGQDRAPLQTRNTVPPKNTTSVPHTKPMIPLKSTQASPDVQPSNELNPKPLHAKGVEGETQADDDTVYFVQQSDGKTIAKTAQGQGVPLTHNIKVRKVNTNETVVVKDKEGNVIFTVEKKGVMSFE